MVKLELDLNSMIHQKKLCQARKVVVKHGCDETAKLTDRMTDRVLHRLTLSDITLQATTKRRRYMRRGSKTPAMLMLSTRLREEISVCTTAQPSPFSEPHVNHKQCKNHTRKLSAVSLLSHQLKTTDLTGHSTGLSAQRPKLVERIVCQGRNSGKRPKFRVTGRAL